MIELQKLIQNHVPLRSFFDKKSYDPNHFS